MDPEICVICLDDINKNSYKLECEHEFHKKCWDEYLEYFIYNENYIKCPTCQKEIKINNLLNPQNVFGYFIIGLLILFLGLALYMIINVLL